MGLPLRQLHRAAQRRRRTWHVPLCWLAAALLTACGGLSPEPRIVATIPPAPTPIPIRLPADLQVNSAAGALIFAQRCATCHGAAGLGDGELVASGQVPSPPSFADPAFARARTPLAWFEVVTNGRIERLMPPWGGALSEQQRWDVTAFIYGLHHSTDALAEGERLWAQHCVECHTAPLSAEALFARSAEDWFARVSAGSADTNEAAESMPAFKDILSDDEIYAALAYARHEAFNRASAAPEVVGSVRGQVINGSAGGGSTAGLEAALFIFDEGFSPQRLDGRTDANGAFYFDDILLRPAYSYTVGVSFRDRLFFSDMARGDAAALELPVAVYELTDDPTAVTILEVVYYVTPVTGGVQIIQVFTLSNQTDRAFSTEQVVADGAFASVTIPLPAGAQGIDLPDGRERYVWLADPPRYADTVPVLPGERHIIQVAYFLPASDSMRVEQRFAHRIDGGIWAQVHPPTLTIRSDQLAPVNDTGDTPSTLLYQSAIVLPQGETLRIDLVPVAASGGLERIIGAVGLPVIIGLIALGVLLVVVGVVGLRLRSRRAS